MNDPHDGAWSSSRLVSAARERGPARGEVGGRQRGRRPVRERRLALRARAPRRKRPWGSRGAGWAEPPLEEADDRVGQSMLPLKTCTRRRPCSCSLRKSARSPTHLELGVTLTMSPKSAFTSRYMSSTSAQRSPSPPSTCTAPQVRRSRPPAGSRGRRRAPCPRACPSRTAVHQALLGEGERGSRVARARARARARVFTKKRACIQ